MYFKAFTSRNMVSPHVETSSTTTTSTTNSSPFSSQELTPLSTTTSAAIAELSLSSIPIEEGQQQVSFSHYLCLFLRSVHFFASKVCNSPNSQSRKRSLPDTSQQSTNGSPSSKKQRTRPFSDPDYSIHSLPFYKKLTALQQSIIQDEYNLLVDHFNLPSFEALRDIEEAHESKARFAEGDVSGFLESFHKHDEQEETDENVIETSTTTSLS